MAQKIDAPAKSYRRKREPFTVPVTDVKRRQPQLPLYFPPHVGILLTPFRAQALQTIYEIAHRELGDRIKSTVVLVETAYDDPGDTTLVLAIWADMDKDEWRRADRAIGDAVFDHTESFDEAEWADYSDIIHFEILPLKL